MTLEIHFNAENTPIAQSLSFLLNPEETAYLSKNLGQLSHKFNRPFHPFSDILETDPIVNSQIVEILTHENIDPSDELLFIELLPLLVKAGFNLNIPNNSQIPFLIHIASKNLISLMENLLDALDQLDDTLLPPPYPLDLNITDSLGRTAFHMACLNGSLEMVKLFLHTPLAYQINFNQSSYDHSAGLDIAYDRNDIGLITELSDDPKISLKSREERHSPFALACFNGDIDIIKALLKSRHLDINDAGDPHFSPLFLACQIGHRDIVELLLADPRLDQDLNKIYGVDNKISLCAVAYKKKHFAILELLLKDDRVNPNEQFLDNQTLLSLACQDANLKIVELLLEHPKIDLNRASFMHDKPLVIIVNKFIDSQEPPTEENPFYLIVKKLLLHQKINPNTTTWGIPLTCIGLSPNENYQVILDLLRMHPRFDPNKTVWGVPIISSFPPQQDIIPLKKLMEHPEIDINQIDYLALFLCGFIQRPIDRAIDTKNLTALKLFLSHKDCLLDFPLTLRSLFDFMFTRCLDLEEHPRTEMIKFLSNFWLNPTKLRRKLYAEHWGEKDISSIFILTSLVSQEFFIVNESATVFTINLFFSFLWNPFETILHPVSQKISELENMKRFFRITKKLPINLQQIIANRVGGLSSDKIPPKEIKNAFDTMILTSYLPEEYEAKGWVAV